MRVLEPPRDPDPEAFLRWMRVKYGDRLRVYGARPHATGHGYTQGQHDTNSRKPEELST